MTAEHLPTALVAYDEMVSGRRALRPHWRDLMALVWGMPPEMLREKQARAAGHLAAADNLFTEGAEPTPHWGMDLLPLIIPDAEWQGIAAGMAQRAKLLNLVLEDIYGPQTLIRDKLLPPFLVFNNPAFLRPVRFVTSPLAPPLHFYAADLVRMPDGGWRVLADRTQAPGAVGYALRHRSVAARSFPEAFRNAAVRRLQPAVDEWQASLQAIGGKLDDNPRIVLLTPGPHNASYPEHVLLAQELGITLAQGSDLTVREGLVYLRTLDGLARVHVIYRRVDGEYCDPLELRADSALGVAGLVAAVRAGNVVLLNLPGTAVAETPGLAPFLPAIARKLLGEELTLPAVTTWWCGQKAPLEEVLNTPEKFVLQQAFHPEIAPLDLARSTDQELAGHLAALRAAPGQYVAVERVMHSRVPAFSENGLEPRPVVLRVGAFSAGDTWRPVPGGVARIANSDDQRQALHLGGIVKDVWILKDEPAEEGSHAESLVELRKTHKVPDAVGSRVADDLFWLGRYAERLDAGARQLRSTVTRLVRGNPSPRETAELQLLAHLLHNGGWIGADDSRAPVDGAVFTMSVVTSMTPNGSVARYQGSLRQIAVSLRDRLSQDMWRIVSVLTRPLAHTAGDDFDSLLGSVDAMLMALSAFNGTAAENMTRGMGWRFLEIGRRIERGIQICNAVDTMFGGHPARVEASVRLLLELCDSVMTHRKRFPMDSYSLAATDIVLTEARNPRGLAYQLEALRKELDGLIGHDPLAEEKQLVDRLLESLRAPTPLADLSPDRFDALTEGLGVGARTCRSELISLSDMLTRSFFTHIKIARSVVFAARDGDEDRAAS
ncbi:MAG: circularly permuted type 2 ATP-grasp protein [Rhodospirillaceae bacterium]|nr:circularly permuted type 2 ATP-grasp protein [Rhodospirillaceae bacterium]